jgi:hypothetical protein
MNRSVATGVIELDRCAVKDPNRSGLPAFQSSLSPP